MRCFAMTKWDGVQAWKTSFEHDNGRYIDGLEIDYAR